MLDVCLKLYDFREKKECKMVLPFWRTSLEKIVGFALLKKSEELFLELAVKLSARGRGGGAHFARRLCHPSANVAKPMKNRNLHVLSRDFFDSSSW